MDAPKLDPAKVAELAPQLVVQLAKIVQAIMAEPQVVLPVGIKIAAGDAIVLLLKCVLTTGDDDGNSNTEHAD